jgi:RNA-binding protein
LALSPRARAHLRSLAHHLKPVHQVGREGVTEATIAAVQEAFNRRELIKIRVQEASPSSAHEAGPLLSERIAGVEHVQTIGRVVVLYRRHPEEPQISLPE